MLKLCTNCENAIESDYGYSDYTVEGTEVDCKLDLNVDLPTDRFYTEEPALKFAEICPAYRRGDPEHHFVECSCSTDPGSCTSDRR